MTRIQILVEHEADIVVDTPEAWWAKSDWEHMEAADGRLAGRMDKLVRTIEEACKAAGLKVSLKPYPDRGDV
jgi:hypothetical protein